MTRDDLGVTRRQSTHGTSVKSINRPYYPDRQVSVEDLHAARTVLQAMLDGGELLAQREAPPLISAIQVIDESIAGAERREMGQ